MMAGKWTTSGIGELGSALRRPESATHFLQAYERRIMKCTWLSRLKLAVFAGKSSN